MATTTHLDAAQQVETTPYNVPESRIGGQVRTLLDSRFRVADQDERRQYKRHPFPYLLRIQPVDGESLIPCGESIVAVCKQLSEKGIDFYHQSPLPHRHVIASLQTSSGNWLSFLVDLTWCRFGELGWYENGGRFLKVMDAD